MNQHITRRSFAQCLAAACISMRFIPSPISAAELTMRDETPLEFVKANNAFAFAMLKRQVQESPTENHFLSPFSLESALLMALAGAREKTAVQMCRALQFPSSLQAGDSEPDRRILYNDYLALRNSVQPQPADESARSQIAELNKQLVAANAEAQRLTSAGKFAEARKASNRATDLADRINKQSKTLDPYELSTANSVWVDKSYPLSPDYQRTMDQIFGTSTANSCDFQAAPEEERVRINDWVANNTRNRIRDIIPPGHLSPETRLVLANAIYFKGNWAKPFDTSRTARAEFTTSKQAKSPVNMMFAPAMKEARYAAFEKDGTPFDTPTMIGKSADETRAYPSDGGYQVVELPYVGERLSMILVLPRKSDGLNRLIESLSRERFAALRHALKARPVDVKLPKFKLETTYNLIPDFQALGMKDAFSPQLANFSGSTNSLSPEHRLYISLIIHKAFVEVNEQGTEAAAATVVGMDRSPGPPSRPFIPEFTADHPFLFSIIDNVTNLILFIGKVDSISDKTS